MSPPSAPRNGQTNEVQPLTGRDRLHPASIASENSTLATFFYADQPRIPHQSRDGLIKDAHRDTTSAASWRPSWDSSFTAMPDASSISKPGEACARCRFKVGSCSLSTRPKETKKRRRAGSSMPYRLDRVPRLLAPNPPEETSQTTRSGTESGQAEPALSGDDTQTTSRDSLSTQPSTLQLVEIIELTDSSDDEMPVHLESDVEEINRIISCSGKGEDAEDTPRSSEMQSVDFTRNEQGVAAGHSQNDNASRNVNLLTSAIDHSSPLECVLDRFEKDEDHITAAAAARAAVADFGGPVVNPATYGAVYAATISNLRILRNSPQGGTHTVKA
ncbi:uncharacterized protein J3D65DRAFT_606032 [Phyllosticta citribraziliensis]|uniref:Uncharacterized protein n=1 Tax=Phyllosticta citribraziliensis TaxID=989973 RepID=A0ABR1L9Z2_9PEZI